MRDQQGPSPLKILEHDLHGPVTFAILLIFAFANAGLAFGGLSVSDVTHPVALGVTLGLLVGKPVALVSQ